MDEDLPDECPDCGTYCGGNCPCNPAPPREWVRKKQAYQRFLAEVEKKTGVVTFPDGVRAYLVVSGLYREKNIEAIVACVAEFASSERGVTSVDERGIDYTDEYGNVWFLDRDLFVDQSTPQGAGGVTISPEFLDEIRNGPPREKSPELIVTHEVIREIYAHLANPEEPCFLWELFSHEESKYSNLVFPDPPPDGPLEAYNEPPGRVREAPRYGGDGSVGRRKTRRERGLILGRSSLRRRSALGRGSASNSQLTRDPLVTEGILFNRGILHAGTNGRGVERGDHWQLRLPRDLVAHGKREA